MIIDARAACETRHGRPFTFSAAVANALDGIGQGEKIVVDCAIDPIGNEMDIARLAMVVSKQKGDRVFTVRQSKDENILATITRLK